MNLSIKNKKIQKYTKKVVGFNETVVYNDYIV